MKKTSTLFALALVASCLIVPNSIAQVEPQKLKPISTSNKILVYNHNILNINKNDYIYKVVNNKYNNNSNKRVSRASSRMYSRLTDLANAIGQVESHGNYKAKSRWSSACGKYQYIKSTWNNYKGYKTACKAPAHVQDARMMHELQFNFKRFGGDWEKVIAAHFYPKWAKNKKNWNRNVRGNNLSIREYINKVKKKAKTL